MKKLLILGAGGHGKVVLECAISSNNLVDIAFLDDSKVGQCVQGYKIIGGIKELESFKEEYDYAIVAIGNNKLRLNLIDKLINAGYSVPSIIHPSAVVSSSSHIGQGVVILPGAVVNAEAQIQKGAIINTRAIIEHDNIIEEGVHISPGVNLGGTVHVGRYTWICIGATVINNIEIGENCIIAAGAVVTQNVEENLMVAGVPAVIKKRVRNYE